MYLTKKRKQAIIRGVWEMRLNQIDVALAALNKSSPRNRQRRLLTALRAACDAKLDEAMLSIAVVYLAEFRTIPPAFYWLDTANSRIYFPGDRLDQNTRVKTVNLGLVHPQVYR